MQLIAHHCITFEARQLNDKLFFTKLFYQMNTRVFRWLQQCQFHIDREKVYDSLPDFTPLVNSILMDQFYQVLPSTFKSPSEIIDDDEPRKKKP